MSLFTAPYVNRVLGVENIGLFNFAHSVLSFVLVFSGLGLAMVAVREISRNREDNEKIKIIFSSVLVASVTASLIVFIPYLLFAVFFAPFENIRVLLLLFIISLALNSLNTEWLFTGLENFGYIAVRSVTLRLLSVVALFIFVRSESDLIIYTVITIAALCGLHLLNIGKGIKIVGFSFKRIRPLHFAWLAKIFFIQGIVVSTYQILDRMILGIFSVYDVGLYAVARNIVFIAITIMLVLPNTIAPRSALLYQNDKDQYRSLLKKAFTLTMYALVPACIGIFVLSSNLIGFMGGEQFSDAIILLRILSFLPLLICVAGFIHVNVSVPAGRERNTLIANIAVAVVSLTINLAFVRTFGGRAASVALLAGEALGLVIMIFLVLKQKILPNILSFSIFKFVFSGVIMAIALFFISPLISLGNVIDLIILASAGVVIYFVMNFLISLIFKKEDEVMILIKQTLWRKKIETVAVNEAQAEEIK